MELFEVFKQKSIKIHSDASVDVSFLKTKTLDELLSNINDDIILIKRDITLEESAMLANFPHHCEIFTTCPKSLYAFDAVTELQKFAYVQILKNVDLNYLYGNKTLFVFDDNFSNSEIPNAVSLTPVLRSDIETIISIDSDKLEAFLNGHDEPEYHQQTIFERTESQEEIHKEEPAWPDEITLIRKKINELMNEEYEIVKVSMPRTSIERTTISLTEFYKNNKIAQGRLRGTWEVFDKEMVSRCMDVGIAKKALDLVNKKYTATIENAFRIVKKTDLSAFEEEITNIEKDYNAYLSGEKIEKIGSVKVKKPLEIIKMIESSIDELHKYLFDICKNNRIPENDIKYFIKESIDKLVKNISGTKFVIKYSAFSERQLQQQDYINSLCATCFDDNVQFFSEELRNLIIRLRRANASHEKVY